MVDVGRAALALALVISVFGVVAPVMSVRWGFPELQVAGRRAIYVIGALVSVAGLLLLYAFVTHDFSLKYVANYSAVDSV